MNPIKYLILSALLLSITKLASANEENYLCKVTGNYGPAISGSSVKSGQINELISMTIYMRPKTTGVSIEGSEHTHFALWAGIAGQSIKSENLYSTNLSNEDHVELMRSENIVATKSGIISSFSFNRKTSFMSFTRNYTPTEIFDTEHSNFSGVCQKK